MKNKKTEEHDCCEHCECEGTTAEVLYRDADGDNSTLFLCTDCIEESVWV